MRKKLLLTLLSSWVVNPLGIALVQFNGMGSSSELKLFLLISGATVAFQLLLNECYAACDTGHERGVKDPFLFLVVAIQLISLLSLRGEISEADIYFESLVFGAVVGVVLSFLTAKRYYIALRNGKIDYRGSFAVGAIPGSISLVLYFAIVGVARAKLLELLIFMLAFLPQLMQYLYVRLIVKQDLKSQNGVAAPAFAFIGKRFLIFLIPLGGVFYFSGRSVLLKADLVVWSPGFSVILIYASNMILTLMNLVMKASHISDKGRAKLFNSSHLLMVGLVCALVIELVNSTDFSTLVLLIIVSQVGIVSILEAGRSLISGEAPK